MKSEMKKVITVESYIESFPQKTRSRLKKVRALILKNAKEVVESISYGMPAYKTHGKPLLYFAGYESHIGLYATPSANVKFSDELSLYKQGKGSIQFPLNEPLPTDLLLKIIKYRVEENHRTIKKKKAKEDVKDLKS
ncbi:DUF1801 domain-containing protein [Leptospira ognonensis]|uniref:DUF1801 domain-containing protein n=1 Tax=Leptospira ognonensis TaxID=2484945 RepID=A0A4R9K459_9LEPT|nr:DUF1801 domain-containing protein [Leptospira ognonensis]TGL60236.1 DUF1801 domain-containing protein [Leptospira ognonensis]